MALLDCPANIVPRVYTGGQRGGPAGIRAPECEGQDQRQSLILRGQRERSTSFSQHLPSLRKNACPQFQYFFHLVRLNCLLDIHHQQPSSSVPPGWTEGGPRLLHSSVSKAVPGSPRAPGRGRSSADKRPSNLLYSPKRASKHLLRCLFHPALGRLMGTKKFLLYVRS